MALILFSAPQVIFAEDNETAKITPDEEVAKSINKVAFDLYGTLAGGNSNMVFSPLGITASLSMVYAGAGGNTAEEIRRALDLNAPKEVLFDKFREITESLNSGEEDIRSVRVFANAMWVQKGFPIEEKYSAILANSFSAKSTEVDFKDDPASACQAINKWCKENTRGKIPNGIGPGAITPLLRLILTNTLYFKDSWRYPFYERLTKKDKFHVSGSETVQADMMCREGGLCSYMNESDFSALMLEYRRGMMCILLPDNADGLAALEKKMNAQNFNAWYDKFRLAKIKKVVLPKFKISSTLSAGDNVKALGINEAFSPDKADLSKITKTKGLFVSEMLQQSLISVDENGTEAASFTRTGSTLGGPPPKPKEEIVFIADHPFIFVILDYSHRSMETTILFMGRVVNPNNP
jgi:serpin B